MTPTDPASRLHLSARSHNSSMIPAECHSSSDLHYSGPSHVLVFPNPCREEDCEALRKRCIVLLRDRNSERAGRLQAERQAGRLQLENDALGESGSMLVLGQPFPG